jgi:hypothetical protein
MLKCRQLLTIFILPACFANFACSNLVSSQKESVNSALNSVREAAENTDSKPINSKKQLEQAANMGINNCNTPNKSTELTPSVAANSDARIADDCEKLESKFVKTETVMKLPKILEDKILATNEGKEALKYQAENHSLSILSDYREVRRYVLENIDIQTYDLNNDKKSDYIIITNWLGSNNTLSFVFLGQGNSFKKVFQDNTRLINIAQTKTKEHNDLYVWYYDNVSTKYISVFKLKQRSYEITQCLKQEFVGEEGKEICKITIEKCSN